MEWYRTPSPKSRSETEGTRDEMDLRVAGVGARLCFGSQPQQLPMAEGVWKGGLDPAIGLLRLVFDTAALRRQQLGYTA